jgi:lysine 2,3-aminomutase
MKIKANPLQEISNQMPVRVTGYLNELCKKSPALARQFLPDSRELDPKGNPKPWVGVLETGIPGLERMYPDRCIIMPISQCPAYCRFCFRKFYDKNQPAMSYKELDRALDYVRKDRRLKSVLITGGDPLMDLKRLEYLLKNLRQIRHIQDIRIGSRSIMYDPARITDDLVKMLLQYHHLEKSQPLEIATHFNHPDELTPQSRKAITKLTGASLRLYNQTVLLKTTNDNPRTLLKLFRQLRLLGVEIYYLFHCEPVKGISHFRTTIEKGLEIKKYLREQATGRINPAYIVSTSIGKVEIGVDGFLEEKEDDSVWIKTPYHLSTFQSVDPAFQLPPGLCRLDAKGFISIKYLL